MFSPLALTQTLPFLPLAQGDIDYQVARRGDPDLFDTLFAEGQRRYVESLSAYARQFLGQMHAPQRSSGGGAPCWPCRAVRAMPSTMPPRT